MIFRLNLFQGSVFEKVCFYGTITLYDSEWVLVTNSEK